METVVLSVEGMECAACVRAVTQALEALGGVATARVSLSERQAVVDFDPAHVSVGHMTEAIADEGYTAIPEEWNNGHQADG